MLQNFQQQPVKPDANTQPPLHTVQTQAQNITTGLGVVTPQPLLPTQPAQQKTTFDKVAVCFCFCIWTIKLMNCSMAHFVAKCLEYVAAEVKKKTEAVQAPPC